MNQVTTPRPGDSVAGRYRIERLLGAGAFARVFLARHERIASMLCAIKILHGEKAKERESVRRFIREAETAAALQSRHVVRVTDFGETDEGNPFLVMDLVRGQALDDVLKRVGRLTSWQAARIAQGVLKALHEAHALGIVHRDLKPGNILLHLDGSERHAVPRVADFGIAKVLRDVESPVEAESMTMGDIVLCTPHYAAPELLGGNPIPQTDLYALAHTLYEMVMGQVPYAQGNHIQIASRHLSPDPLVLPDDFPASGLGKIVLKAAAKKLSERYATAADMLHDVEAWLATQPPAHEQEPIDVEIPPEIPWTGPVAARSRNEVPRGDAPTPNDAGTRAVEPTSPSTTEFDGAAHHSDASSETVIHAGVTETPAPRPASPAVAAASPTVAAVSPTLASARRDDDTITRALILGVGFTILFVVVGILVITATRSSGSTSDEDETAAADSGPNPVLALEAASSAVEEAHLATSRVLVLDADLEGVQIILGDETLGETPLDASVLPVARPLELELVAPDGDSMPLRVVSHGPFVFEARFGGPVIAADDEPDNSTGAVPGVDEATESDASSSSSRRGGVVRSIGRGVGNAFQRRDLE